MAWLHTTTYSWTVERINQSWGVQYSTGSNSNENRKKMESTHDAMHIYIYRDVGLSVRGKTICLASATVGERGSIISVCIVKRTMHTHFCSTVWQNVIVEKVSLWTKWKTRSTSWTTRAREGLAVRRDLFGCGFDDVSNGIPSTALFVPFFYFLLAARWRSKQVSGPATRR